MLKSVIAFCVFVVAIDTCVGQGTDKMGGRGKWKVHNIAKCEEDAMFTIKADVTRHKCGRTVECYDAVLSLDKDIDDSIGVRVDVCKFVDGGACQAYQTLADDSIARFIKKYAEQNMISALTLAGIDPPEFPIKEGEVIIEEFPFDFCEMPEKAMYGEFKAKCLMLQDSQEIACIEFHIEFFEIDEDVDCEDVE